MSIFLNVIQALRKIFQEAEMSLWPEQSITFPLGALGEDEEEWIDDAVRNTREAILISSSLPSMESSPCYYRGLITLQVYYSADIPEDLRAEIIFQDCIDLSRAITDNPHKWGGADSIWPNGGVTVRNVFDDDGGFCGQVLRFPIEFIIH